MLRGKAQTGSISTEASLLPLSREKDLPRRKGEPPPSSERPAQGPQPPRIPWNTLSGSQGPVYSDLFPSVLLPPASLPVHFRHKQVPKCLWHGRHSLPMHGISRKATETRATEPYRRGLSHLGLRFQQIYTHVMCFHEELACALSLDPHMAGSVSFVFLIYS